MPFEPASCLASGETILWQAQPRPYVFLLRGLTAMTYGATWAILGAFWYHGSGGIGRYSAFEGWWRLEPLLSVPFILAGLSFFFYPIRLGVRARRTWYVVTNHRILTLENKKEGPTSSVFPAAELGTPLLVQRFDGLYDCILTRRAQEQIAHLGAPLEAGFFGLEEPAATTLKVLLDGRVKNP